MESFKAFLSANRLPVVIGLSTLVVAVIGLSFVAGLTSTITIALFLAVVGLAIQAVPYGRDHTNPPITGEPAWDSPVTRDLAVRACFDCHSNEVEYPWYSQIAPVSWAVQSHIDSGRSKVNYSEWDQPQKKADESAETVIDGEMPPAYFTRFTHAEARLTESERQQLIDGLTVTFGGEDDGDDDDDDDDDD